VRVQVFSSAMSVGARADFKAIVKIIIGQQLSGAAASFAQR
jgi:3-methyladenine DNA glycosylase/8-oxoguanine DNA glycosylase